MYEISTSSLILFSVMVSFTFFPTLVFAQETTDQVIPKGDVVNSKYLSIAEHRYRIGDFSDQITGVIVNNSTAEVSGISVDAALYDNANKLITMEGAGFADVSTLPPSDSSAFSITILSLPEEVDHYTLFPSGTP
jgi:hypothetical protein